jgi:chemotaxis protein CheD
MKRNEAPTVPTAPGFNDRPPSSDIVSVGIGQWAVVAAPVKIRTLLGSCVGVVLYDRAFKVGGLAHIVLPAAPGSVDHPGKYADTAIPGMIADFDRRLVGMAKSRLVAKLVGGASMFQISATTGANLGLNIGQRNRDAIEQILAGLRIPIVARDLGGESGRRLTFDTASGIVTVKVPGGADYEI